MRVFNNVVNINQTLDLVVSNVIGSDGGGWMSCATGCSPSSVISPLASVNSKWRFSPTSEVSYNYKRANFLELYHNTFFLCSWDNVLSSSDVDVAVHRFYGNLNLCLSKHIPKSTSHRCPKWYIAEIIRLI